MKVRIPLKKSREWLVRILLVSVLIATSLLFYQTISMTSHMDSIIELEEAVAHGIPKSMGSWTSTSFQNASLPFEVNPKRRSSSGSWLETYMQEYNSSKLPNWMKEYFEWHKVQIRDIDEDHWAGHRFLVLKCKQTDKACSGTPDTLRPIPLLLRMAYESKRIFYIHWTYPHRLEEFLEPNVMNWTVPTFLTTFIDSETKGIGVGSNHLWKWAQGKHRIVQGLAQSADAGQSMLSELVGKNNTKDYLYEGFYRDLFRAMFRPSPNVAQLVQQHMDGSQLVPGQFTTAHFYTFWSAEKENFNTAKLKLLAINAMD